MEITIKWNNFHSSNETFHMKNTSKTVSRKVEVERWLKIKLT